MSTIVLATDLSDEARHAARWAFAWAKKIADEPATVVAVEVVTAEEAAIKRIIYDRHDDAELEQLTDAIATWIEPHHVADVPLVIEAYAGSVVDGLIRACKDHHADYLVLSMSGKGALGRLFLGSTASRIAHRPPCPTFVVHGKPMYSPDAPHVVAAVDFSATSLGAALRAAELAKGLSGSLTLVHVIEIPRLVPTMGDAELYPQTITAHIEESSRWARGELERFVAEHPRAFDGLSLRLDVRPGYPAQELIAFCEEEQADLVVIGNAGRSALGDFLMGSVATRVVNAMPATLLILPPATTVEA
jgi:nucleotide-binding universal stress UspA family protein